MAFVRAAKATDIAPGQIREIPLQGLTIAVANVGGQEIRAMTVIDQPLTETVVWNQMIQSFLSPMEGAPARPATLVVCRRDFCDTWIPLLSEIGVRCQYENDPQPVGRLLEAMGDEIDKRALPPAEVLGWQVVPAASAPDHKVVGIHPHRELLSGPVMKRP